MIKCAHYLVAGLLLLSLSWGQGPRQPQVATASIEGRVINSQTGRPLENVHVQLICLGTDSPLVYGANSNAGGYFSIKGMQPCGYFLNPEKTGFALAAERAKKGSTSSIYLKAGERLTDFRLLMTPRARLAGHVLDEYGEPLASVSVQLIPLKTDGIRQGSSTSTNDLGEFRLSASPGKYYVKAAYNSATSSGEPEEIRTDGTTDTIYSDTYYPDAASTNAATAIELKPGSELSGIDIRLVHGSAHAIVGIISGIPRSATQVSVTLASGNSASTSGFMVKNEKEKPFRFASLSPGTYGVYAECSVGDQRLRSQIVQVNLADADATLDLALARGSDLEGKVETAHQAASAVLAGSRFVSMQIVDVIGTVAMNSPVAADGSFRMKDVQPGKYLVSLAPLPENGYVEAVQLDGTEVPDHIIDLSKGADGRTLKVIVNPNGAQIAGTIHAADGTLFRLPALVILFDSMSRPQATQSNDGAYSFRSLPPGKYRVLALERSDVRGEFSDLMTQYAQSADVVGVRESERVSRDLKLITPAEPKE